MSTRNPVKISVSQEAVDAVAQASEQGYRISEIADVLGIGRSTVYRAAAVLGLPFERDMNRTIDAVLPLWRENRTTSEIAEWTGISAGQVRRALYRAGISSDDLVPAPYTPKSWTIPALDPVWAAEFRGFFYADGCIVIDRASNSYRPYMTINLRADDEKVLEQIHAVLGGGMSRSAANHSGGRDGKPQARWYVASWPGCRAIIEATNLHRPVLLAKKRRDVQLLYEAILARYEMPNRMGPENKVILEKYRVQLQEIKRFQL